MTQVGRDDEVIYLLFFFTVTLKYEGIHTKTKDRNDRTGTDFCLRRTYRLNRVCFIRFSKLCCWGRKREWVESSHRVQLGANQYAEPRMLALMLHDELKNMRSSKESNFI